MEKAASKEEEAGEDMILTLTLAIGHVRVKLAVETTSLVVPIVSDAKHLVRKV